MINHNHLALFRAVAEAGGFSRAAQAVHVSQPAISMQVAELEKSFGAPLFDRLPRGVRLTEAGRTLLGYAQRISALEIEAERAMQELRGLKRGRLALGASMTIGGYLLPAVLGKFHRRHPGIELQLVIANTETIKSKLTDGTLDLVLTEGMPPQDERLSMRVFREDELIVIAPADHSLLKPFSGKRRPRPITALQLCAHPLILREPGSGTREVLLRTLAENGAKPGEVVLTLTDT